jgi:hypothetical protein
LDFVLISSSRFQVSSIISTNIAFIDAITGHPAKMSISDIEYKKGGNVDEKDLSHGVTVTLAEDTVEAAHECTPIFYSPALLIE